MSEHRPQELAGLAAAGLAVCCGLPVLLGAGAVGATVGFAVGSSFFAAVGVIVSVVGWRRWRQWRACCAEQIAERASAASGEG